jgi:hypothetical protein
LRRRSRHNEKDRLRLSPRPIFYACAIFDQFSADVSWQQKKCGASSPLRRTIVPAITELGD